MASKSWVKSQWWKNYKFVKDVLTNFLNYQGVCGLMQPLTLIDNGRYFGFLLSTVLLNWSQCSCFLKGVPSDRNWGGLWGCFPVVDVFHCSTLVFIQAWWVHLHAEWLCWHCYSCNRGCWTFPSFLRETVFVKFCLNLGCVYRCSRQRNI